MRDSIFLKKECDQNVKAKKEKLFQFPDRSTPQASNLCVLVVKNHRASVFGKKAAKRSDIARSAELLRKMRRGAKKEFNAKGCKNFAQFRSFIRTASLL